MVTHVVPAAVLAPLVGSLLLRFLADRVRPGGAAVLSAWTAAGLALSSLVSLVVFALWAVVEATMPGPPGGWPGGHAGPWLPPVLVAAMLATTAAALGRAARDQRRALRALRRRTWTPPDGEGVVLVAGSTVDAFSVPGRPGRIVVTEGMRDALLPDQYAAMIAHERAHLAGRHHRLVTLARLAAAAHPALRSVARQVEYLVERSADEEAARQTGDRPGVARAIGTAALAAARSGPGDQVHAAPVHGAPVHSARVHSARVHSARVHSAPVHSAPMGGARRPAALRLSGGAVPRRMAALLGPLAPARRGYLLTVPAMLAVGSMAWTAECVVDLVEAVRVARQRLTAGTADG